MIRETRVDDLSAVAALYAYYVRVSAATFELEPPRVAEMERRWRAAGESGYPHLVAEMEGHIAGFASASAFRSRPAYRSTVEDTVYVDAEFVGRGVGTALLCTLLEKCRALGFRQMVAVVGGENPPSIALHARAGFRTVGVLREVGWKFEAWQDVTLMQKEL